MSRLWKQCLNRLENELSQQLYSTWILPLQGREEEGSLLLLAPNNFVLDWVNEQFLERIKLLVHEIDPSFGEVKVTVGSAPERTPLDSGQQMPEITASGNGVRAGVVHGNRQPLNTLNPAFTFDTFIEGKSNQLGKAAALQVTERRGHQYNNPLYIYGGVGLGKTHLIHACGNAIRARDPSINIIYLHSERFIADMISSIQKNKVGEFKDFYRSVDVLLIDDVQFLSGKSRSEEEFFHIFNALVEKQHQIVVTCDRYPKDLIKMEDRLKSRFGSGLTVGIDPPDMETRAAIIKSKAALAGTSLEDEVAFFIARTVHSNVRELEGALHRVIAHSHLMGTPISLELVKVALTDLLASQNRQLSIESIQKAVVDYFKIRTRDLTSKSRKRAVTRPRQMAMSLAKELTNHSLPIIGEAFERDHTTVLHACERVAELRMSDEAVDQDYRNLLRILAQ